MPDLTFAESQKLKQIAPDIFQNIHQPWTWPNSIIIPGGVLMSACAAAAYHTVPKDFILDSLQANFLGGPKATSTMTFKVKRLSNGRRFVVRSVAIEQNGMILLTATITFVNGSPWTGPAMTHAVERRTGHTVEKIVMDDLEEGRGRFGSFMAFQRLPVVYKDPSKSVVSGVATSVAQIIPAIEESANNPATHILGIVNLSDYHVMDAPLQLNNITFGLPRVGDVKGPRTENNIKVGTTLNHSIHFHAHDGFRADELTYIEVETLWGRDGRAMLNSKIFSKNGLLIATCTQEAFYVLKQPPTGSRNKL